MYYIHTYTYVYIYIYIYMFAYPSRPFCLTIRVRSIYEAWIQPTRCCPSSSLHPVSITIFLLRIFSPGAGLLRNRFC